MKKIIATILLSVSALSIIAVSPVNATTGGTYKPTFEKSSVTFKGCKKGDTKTIYAYSINSSTKVEFADVAPEGSNSKIVGQGKVSGTSNKWYCKLKITGNNTSGDYYAAYYTKYKKKSTTYWDSKASKYTATMCVNTKK